MKPGIDSQSKFFVPLPLGQFVRYCFTGITMTGFYAALYLALVQFFISPMESHFIAYSCAIVVGFFLNRFWSFRGHGRQDQLRRNALRFTIVSLVGMAINSLFVCFLTGPIMQGPYWWPLVPIVLFTPLLTFVFNRFWAFS